MTPAALRYVLALAGFGLRLGAEPTPMRIWPGAAPGEKGGIGQERDTTKPSDQLIAGKPVIRIGNVSDPTIAVYSPPAGRNTGVAVVVCPGGGYYILALDLEGTEVCEWLNSIGVTGVLLKYRVPRREGRPPFAAPLQDAQRAVGLVRLRAKEWGIDPRRVGVLGFSAGGNLCAVLSAAGPRTYPRVDDADDLSCRPDFQLLIYPGSLVKEGGYGIEPEVAVAHGPPPTFLAMAQDDPVRVENVLGYALALQGAKVPMELHVYPTGGHGYGLRPAKDYVTTWPQRAADWMRSRGILGAEVSLPR
ncbi:MAG TPA: alpha/beta hydrolase [Opitutaceae bacterium]|nr:alpha/beta hydrolase [Opitutaceae bacterium]